MQIQPREYFTIARGLQDPSDLTTYYVQAVIRNARTDEVIDTVNLTDNGSRRFTKPWQAPADVSGDGLYILITISVYTDSGYSVRAENYGDSFDEHLIQARPTPAMLNQASGPDIDYNKIQRMIDASLKNFKPVQIVQRNVDMQPILQAIAAKSNIEPAEPVDFGPITQAFAFIRKDLTELLARPKFEKADLSQFADMLAEMKKVNDGMQVTEIQKRFSDILDKLLERTKGFLETDILDIKKEMTALSNFVNNIQYIIPKTENSNMPPKASEPEDPIALANEMAAKGKK